MKILLLLYFSLFTLIYSHEGLTYTVIEKEAATGSDFSTSKLSIHVVEVDPTLYEILPVKALDNGIGRESVDSIAKRHNAICGINGGFFSIGGMFDGKACGALKINEWVALPFKPRGCIGWSKNDQKPIFDRLIIKVFCNYQQKSYLLDGLNKPRKEESAILYTPNFHRTTLTFPEGQEIITSLEKIVGIKNSGSNLIPDNGAVLSLDNAHPLLNQFSLDQELSFSFAIESMTNFTNTGAWQDLDYIVGGTPLLVVNGEQISDFSPELTIPTFLSRRHSRTAIGLLPNGNWVFIVVDKTNHHNGMTMLELTDFMSQKLGCSYALNLDGGGSSTLFYDGNITNDPHGDEDEGSGQKMIRRVSDAIVIRKK